MTFLKVDFFSNKTLPKFQTLEEFLKAALGIAAEILFGKHGQKD